MQTLHSVGVLAAVCGLLAIGAIQIQSQSTFGSIRGTAQDSAGGVLPDAEVRLHSDDQNTDRVVKTDGVGNYLIENVLAGKYSIRARREGFADTTMSGITLSARQDLRLTLTMAVAAQTTTVEVTSAANQINTEDAVLSDSKGTSQSIDDVRQCADGRPRQCGRGWRDSQHGRVLGRRHFDGECVYKLCRNQSLSIC